MNDRDVFVDNPLSLSWCNPKVVPCLNQNNILDYFAERSNPFYDHTCNNEMLRMRGIPCTIGALSKMQGLEYVLLHVQEPILYVIRKQKRLSPTATSPIANYYIICGTIYQAPDMLSIIQSKLVTSIHHLQSAFDECFSYARFHPSTDYYWDFSKDGSGNGSLTAANSTDNDSKKKQDSKNKKGDSTTTSSSDKKKEISVAEANDTARHMYRVDILLHELMKKFPLKPQPSQNAITSNSTNDNKTSATENGDNNSGNPKLNGTDSTIAETSNSTSTTTTAASTTTTTTNTGTTNSEIKSEPEDDYKSNNNSNSKLGPNPSKKAKFN